MTDSTTAEERGRKITDPFHAIAILVGTNYGWYLQQGHDTKCECGGCGLCAADYVVGLTAALAQAEAKNRKLLDKMAVNSEGAFSLQADLEKAEAERERYREALQEIANRTGPNATDRRPSPAWKLGDVARAALEGGTAKEGSDGPTDDRNG